MSERKTALDLIYGVRHASTEHEANMLIKDWAASKGWGKPAQYQIVNHRGRTVRNGGGGGWIFTKNGDGSAAAQGWAALARKYGAQQVIDWLARQLIGVTVFELVEQSGSTYRPTMLVRGTVAERYRWALLADAYDEIMQARGDARRAWRGTADAARAA